MSSSIMISVIVSVFNQEKYIGRCLRSLLNQTLNKDIYEIIVVNDGSKDKSAYALDLFSDPNNNLVKIIDHNKNLVFSCGSGVTASVLALAYSLINDKYHPCIYDGSWAEYGKI